MVRGEVSAVVTFTGAHTFFGKTAMLIQAASDSESNMQVRRRGGGECGECGVGGMGGALESEVSEFTEHF